MENEEQKVQIIIYNVQGKEIRRLVDGTKKPAFHSVTWDGTNAQGMQIPSGMYVCRMKAGNFVKIRTIMLQR